MVMNKMSFKGFYRFSDFDHLKCVKAKRNLKEQFNIVQKLPDDGVEYEFMISFYNCGENLSARVEIFDDAFVAFETHEELFEKLAKLKRFTPDDIENLLISIGYRNLTKEEVENDGK